MNAGKRESVAGPAALWGGLMQPGRPRLIAAAVSALVVLALLLSTWRRMEPAITSDSDFALTPEKIEITPPPDWIDSQTNITAEVYRDASLHELSLLDEQAAVRIARAFELHTWVKRVVRVQKKAPGRVAVELEYRKPVALVEVLFNNVLSYEPVDASGVVLPEDLFHRDEKQLDHYLRITADYSMPSGVLGTPWGDARISGAANIAAMLEKAWKKWNLYRIVAHPPEPHTGKCTFELRTRGNSRVLWGHAPGHELSGEPDALQKLARLAHYLREHGALDLDGRPAHDIDLRSSAGLQASPRTASRQ